jgi:hypothetical protein
VGLAVVLGRAEAWAAPCSTPTPACHREAGTELLTSDPKRAAAELLASYQLDERTDTLALYATALALDHRYALALDTWKRVIVFRDSELEAAREAARTSTGRKRAAARAAAARAEQQSEQAAEAIIQLWQRVGRVRIRPAPGPSIAVSRDGAAVDPSQDVIVNAGGDELVFTHPDGRVDRVAVQVAAGAFAKIDAPAATATTSDAAVAAKPRSADAPVAPPAKPAAPADATARRRDAGDAAATAPRPAVAAAREVHEPRDATRGGVNGPASPGQRGRESPLSINATRGGVNGAASPGQSGRESPLSINATRGGVNGAASPGQSGREGPLSIDPRSLTLARVGLGLVAGAVVAGGVAGSFGYLASRDFDRARDAGCSGDGRCPFGPAADLAEQSNHRARIAQISAASAAALAATGATLWWVGHTRTHRTVTDVALRVGRPSSEGGLSAALSGRF